MKDNTEGLCFYSRFVALENDQNGLPKSTIEGSKKQERSTENQQQHMYAHCCSTPPFDFYKSDTVADYTFIGHTRRRWPGPGAKTMT